MNKKTLKLNTLKFGNRKQWGGFVCCKKIRDNYLIVATDKGVVFVDQKLKILKKINSFKNIFIQDIYIKQNENEIILNCADINGFLIKINIIDFSHSIINLPEEYHDIFHSKIYFWESDFIILIRHSGEILKIDLGQKDLIILSIKQLSNELPVFAHFFKHMRSNCKRNKNWGVNHWMFYIKYFDFYKSIYVVRDEEEQNHYFIDLKNDYKIVLAPYDELDYSFEYKYDFFITIQEYKVKGFFKGNNIFTIDTPKRAFYGAKLVQDLNHRYVIIITASFLNNDTQLTKYMLPDEI